MDRRLFLIYDLLTVVNSANKETNDTLIARALLENRDVIDSVSMDVLSRKYYVSQAGITRFIKKMGYPDFRSFRQAMLDSGKFMKDRYSGPIYRDPDTAIASVAEDVNGVIDDMQSLRPEVFVRLVELFQSYDRIWFFGSEMSMVMMRLLQMRLETIGKQCYTEYQFNYQKETLPRLDEKSLAVGVSVGGRWITLVDTGIFAKCKAHTLLLVPEDTDVNVRDFDEVLVYGKRSQNDMSYYQLLYLIQTLNRMI